MILLIDECFKSLYNKNSTLHTIVTFPYKLKVTHAAILQQWNPGNDGILILYRRIPTFQVLVEHADGRDKGIIINYVLIYSKNS